MGRALIIAVVGLAVLGAGCRDGGVPVAAPAPEATTPPAPLTTASVSGPVACPPTTAGTRTVTLTVDGRNRTALLVVPARAASSASAGRPVPLVVDFHGHGGTSRAALAGHRLEPLAERDGVVLAYPQGLPQADGLPGWAAGAPSRDLGTVDDVGFTRALVERIASEVCLDRARVTVVGHSNGGGMVGLLACREPAAFASFVAVSAALYGLAANCPTRAALRLLEIHGLDDPIVPYGGRGVMPAILPWVAGVAERAGCTGPATSASEGARGDRRTWTECPAGAAVEHLALAAQGHEWPAEGAEAVWRFAGLGR